MGSDFSNQSAWAGALIFSGFKVDESWRLLAAGKSNKLDEVDDLLNLLIAYDSFLYAYEKISVINDIDLVRDFKILLESFFMNPKIPKRLTKKGFLETIIRGSIAEEGLAFVGKFGLLKIIRGLSLYVNEVAPSTLVSSSDAFSFRRQVRRAVKFFARPGFSGIKFIRLDCIADQDLLIAAQKKTEKGAQIRFSIKHGIPFALIGSKDFNKIFENSASDNVSHQQLEYFIDNFLR